MNIYPPPYVPQAPATLDGGDAIYLRRELQAISTTLYAVLDMLPAPATASPAHPQPGMVRLAQSPWRPVSGQSVDRWVIFTAGAWAYFA